MSKAINIDIKQVKLSIILIRAMISTCTNF